MYREEKIILVYDGWSSDEPKLLGKLYAEMIRGKELFSFEYDEQWLQHCGITTILDPNLSLYQGRQFAPLEKSIFGIFADSCPDRWGRLLMKRREQIIARKEQRKAKQLTERDFLLGVYDQARMGALRFKTEEGGPFLADDDQLAAPPWMALRKLETASYAFEEEESGMQEVWLNQLLAPGSSLGGARPKATVVDPDGALWIAKFPSKHDDYNAGAWEMVVHDLAKECGIDVPEAKLETFSHNGSTFLVKRFDRSGEKRIHFSSAMALLGKVDGASAADGSSYLDLVSFIRTSGSNPNADLLELWKRVIFSIAVSNSDDHLRNHGFLLADNGWKLSPAYDINPSIYGNNLSLNISSTDSTMSFELAVETAKYYGIDKNQAYKIVNDIKGIVENRWEKQALFYNLNRSAVEYMRPAFEMKYK